MRATTHEVPPSVMDVMRAHQHLASDGVPAIPRPLCSPAPLRPLLLIGASKFDRTHPGAAPASAATKVPSWSLYPSTTPQPGLWLWQTAVLVVLGLALSIRHEPGVMLRQRVGQPLADRPAPRTRCWRRSSRW